MWGPIPRGHRGAAYEHSTRFTSREPGKPVSQSLARLTVRPICTSDKSALSDLFDRLSPRSRHHRFLGPKKMLSSRDLQRLTEIDHVKSEALALVAADGRFIAVARYGPVDSDPNAAEVALTVVDEWQGRGIGSAMASLLIGKARRSGVTRLQAMTLAGNDPVRRLLRRLGFTVTSVERDVMSFEMQLVEP